MRWTALLVPVVAASCATADGDGGGRIGDVVALDGVETAGTPTPEAAGDPAPPGTRIEEVDEVGLSFAVPADWITVDADDVVDAAAGTEELDELADRLGVDPATIAELAGEGIAAAVVAPPGSESGPANLNVIELPIPGGLPPRAMLEAGITSAGAEVLDVEVVERAGLPIVEIRYRLEVEGQTFEGVAAFVETDDAAVSLTVSAADRAEADRVADLAVTTLDTLG